jgi:hypothetical protein
VDWIDLAQDRKRQRAFVNAVMSSRDTYNTGNGLNKVPIIRPNATYEYSKTVFYYKLHVSAVQICHHRVDIGHIKRSIKGKMYDREL